MASCEITAMAANTSRCTLISWWYTCFKICHYLNCLLIASCGEQTLFIICCFSTGTVMQARHFTQRGASLRYPSSASTQMDPNVMQEMIEKYPRRCRLLVDGAHWSSKSPHLKLTGQPHTWHLTSWIWRNTIPYLSRGFENPSHQRWVSSHCTDHACTCFLIKSESFWARIKNKSKSKQ